MLIVNLTICCIREINDLVIKLLNMNIAYSYYNDGPYRCVEVNDYLSDDKLKELIDVYINYKKLPDCKLYLKIEDTSDEKMDIDYTYDEDIDIYNVPESKC